MSKIMAFVALFVLMTAGSMLDGAYWMQCMAACVASIGYLVLFAFANGAHR